MLERRFLMEANRKTIIQKKGEMGDEEDGNLSSHLARRKVLDGCQQEDHQKKGEEGDEEDGN